MRNLYRFFLIAALLFTPMMPSAYASSQQPQAPQTASYTMDVQLDPVAKTVSGSERITYRNPSQDTLNEVWLRLYLKAFSSTKTLWMRESGGQLRGDQMQPDHLGDITLNKLALANGTDLLATATLTDTLLHVPLTQPLGPGQALEIDATWVSKLPRVFARTGYGGRENTFFMVGQWYPKMTVYDRGHWDTEPWHGNSEFFNDFGSYDVTISVPKEYVVAGAGVPAGEQANADGSKRLHFTSDNVTDFAFAASPDFKTASAKAGDVAIDLFYMPEHAAAVQEYLDSSVGSIRSFSQWYGQYPHPRLTVVDVPDDASGAGGMEYPTLVTTEYGGGATGFPSYVTSHEIGHQWWPMQTATNEGAEPWLDEGITEYSGMRYMVDTGTKIGAGPAAAGARTYERTLYVTNPATPATLSAWEYTSGDYGTVYFKTALGLWTLENAVGTDRFRAAMQAYLSEWRFKHPQGADFRRSIEHSLGPQPWFFDQYMPTNAVIDYSVDTVQDRTATVKRTGGVAAPVDIRLTLADGEQTTQTWDGADARLTLTAAQSIVQVAIDPAQKLAAETDVTNNVLNAKPQVVPAITLGERLAFWLQIAVSVFGLFG